MRALIRGGAELLATACGLDAVARRRHREQVAILAYHNVVEPEDAGRGDASLHIPLPRFIRQIERLAGTHDIVSLAELGGARDSRRSTTRRGRPRAVVTFDDAYRGAVRLAVPELVQRGIPATVFVSAGLIGSVGTWWDQMAEAGRLTHSNRDVALTELAGRAESVRGRFLADRTLPALPDSYGIASRGELEEHIRGGVSLGSHAWEHEYLPALASGELDESLTKTLRWLSEFDGPTTTWLALPYGGGSRPLARRALDLGHAGVLRIEGGCWRGSDDTDWVPRINVPAGMSERGLALRASGLRS